MKRIALFAVLLVAVAGLLTSSAQWEPTEAIEFIAPSGAGGGWDTICRTTARVLQETGLITQPIYVSNMPGGSGSVAIAYAVTKRAGDAHLLLAASNSLSFSIAIGRALYTYHDVTPLAQIASDYGVIAVLPDSPLKTLGDLVAALRADPKSVTFGGGSAPGAMEHIKIALVAKAIGVDPTEIVYVPFQGAGEAMVGLLGGHVDVLVSGVGKVKGQLEAGQIRILAVLSPKRGGGLMADVPTAIEQGVDVTFPVWRGLYMPPDLPEGAEAFWTETLQKMVETDEWNEAREGIGWQPDTKFGDEFKQYVYDEVERYKVLLKELGFLE